MKTPNTPLEIKMFPCKATKFKGKLIFQPSILGWYVCLQDSSAVLEGAKVVHH